jgi:hypothetical protein
MRGAGGGGTAGAVTVGAGGGADADTAGGAAAGGACAPATTCAGGGVIGRGGGEATDGDDAGGIAAGRGGVGTAPGWLTEAGAAVVGLGAAGLDAAGATVVGRLTPAGGAVEGFSAMAGGAGGVGEAGTAGRAGVAAASFRWVIAFNTSPGREMFERSILVLISSSPRRVREAALPVDAEPSAEERIYARTFSASCSSRELEWVFFSVTPTSGSVSRMALLLTSSSRARSLMRTLLIRPFISPRCS